MPPDVGKAEIDHGDVGMLMLQLVDRASAVGARDDAEPGVPGEPRDEVQYRRLIVHDENGRRLLG